jgi:hypothetical protein
MAKWTQSGTLTLIELYEQNICLYDTRNRDYPNSLKRDAVLQAICNELGKIRVGTTISEIKAKVKTLRSQDFDKRF